MAHANPEDAHSVLPSPADAAEDDPPEEGAPAWALTFGDMMSLLLCFFVLMFSMSEIKVDKYLMAAESLRNGLGNGASPMLEQAGQGGASIVDTDMMRSQPAAVDILISMDDVDDFMKFVGEKLEAFVQRNGLEDHVDVSRSEGGVTLSIQDVVLFDTGSADLRPQSITLMEDLGQIVAQVDMPLVVVGHTDDRPISTVMFPSNWELSSARAARVTRIMVEQGLAPDHVHVEGYAEYQPAATNETGEGRSLNRRVELLYTRDNVISQMLTEKRTEQVLTDTDGMPTVGAPE